MLNPLDLTGQRILVTGASSGIGRATSLLLSELGADLLLVGRNQERLEETRSLAKREKHACCPFDLNQCDAIPAWMQELAKTHGPIAGVVHSAGIQTTRPLRMLSPEIIEESMRINVVAATQLARGFRHRKVRDESGCIIFLASVMGIVGQPGVSAYCASKGAVVSLTRSLALELAREQIRVNCIAPGHVNTEMAEQWKQTLTDEQVTAVESMHPLGLGEPEDVANAIAFLLARTGRWITGTTLVIDGGYTAH